jgi:leader peptidase (prepilin peptidase)/N-methyltransferase
MDNIIQALPVAYFGAVAVPLIITDIREHRLPNKLTIPAIPLTAVSWLALAVMGNRWADFAVALGVAVIVFAVGLGVNRMGVLGMGDVKLFTGLALMLAWFMGLWALLLPVAAVVAAVAHIAIGLAVRKFRMGGSLALGPHIIGSAGLMLGLALV